MSDSSKPSNNTTPPVVLPHDNGHQVTSQTNSKLFKLLLELPAALLVIFSCILLIVILTSTGRTLSSNFLLKYLPLPTGIDLQIKALKSPSIGEWHFDSLVLTRDRKTILSIEQGVVDWQPLDIITGQFRLRKLTAEKINITTHQFTSAAPPVSVQEPLELSINDRLRQLDQSVNKELRALTLQFFPIAINNINIDTLTIQIKDKTYDFHINGQITFGQTSMVAANFNIGHQPQTFQRPITLHTQFTMNQHRQASLKVLVTPDYFMNNHIIFGGEIEAIVDLQQSPISMMVAPSQINIQNELVEIKGALAVDQAGVLLHEFVVQSPKGMVTVTGALKRDTLNLHTTLSQIDPSAYIPKGENIKLNGNLTLTGPATNPVIQGVITGGGTYSKEKAHLHTEITATHELIKFQNAVAKFGDAKATANGQFQLAQRTLIVDAQAEQLALPMLREFRIPIPPEIDLTVQSGHTHIEVVWPNKDEETIESFDHEKKREVDFSLSAAGETSGSIYGVPGNIDAKVALTLQEIHIFPSHIRMGTSHGTGQGTVNWKEKTLDLEFTAEDVIPDTLSWLPFTIPEAIKATLGGELQLTGSFNEPNLTINAIGPLRYLDLSLFTECSFRTNFKAIELDQCDLFLSPEQGRSKIISNTGHIQLKPLNAKLEHNLYLFPLRLIENVLPATSVMQQQLDIDAKAQGKMTSAFNVNSEQQLQLTKVSGDLGLFGTMWGQNIYAGLRGEMSKAKSATSIHVQSLGIDFGDDSHILLSGKIEDQDITLDLNSFMTSRDLKSLPYPYLGAFTQWPANFQIMAKAHGPLKSPNFQGNLEYQANVQQLTSAGDLRNVPLKLLATFQEARHQPLTLHAQIFKNGKVQSELDLETNFITRQIQSFVSSKRPSPFVLTSEGQVNLENLNILLNPVFHQFKGLAFWNIDWRDQFTGQIQLSDASYSHLTLGAQLQDIELDLQIDKQGINIRQGIASDGGQGRYSLSGFLNSKSLGDTYISTKSENANDPFRKTDVTLSVNNALLINRPDFEAIANGGLALHQMATNQMLELSGNLQLQPLEIHLDRTRSDNIPSLDVIPKSTREEKPQNKNDNKNPIKLAINLKTDQQAFLRGKGINAELTGEAAIRGTYQNPIFRGSFNTIRGSTEILGKRFTVETGEVRFDGSRGLLNIRAVHRKPDQEFIALVTGGFEALDVTLQSRPALPEDETLSQLLFGKTLDDISAVQALRIATAVQSLSGRGTGLDPIDTTRDILGVDEVTLDSESTEAGDQNYKIGVGKYVSDRVYVQIERSTNPAEPWQGQVQIEITPNISLETSAESETGLSGVDLKWKRDY